MLLASAGASRSHLVVVRERVEVAHLELRVAAERELLRQPQGPEARPRRAGREGHGVVRLGAQDPDRPARGLQEGADLGGDAEALAGTRPGVTRKSTTQNALRTVKHSLKRPQYLEVAFGVL